MRGTWLFELIVQTDPLAAGLPHLAITVGAAVVTRNRPDFERQGIEVLSY